MIEALLLVFAAEGAATEAVQQAVSEPNPKTMTQKEIRAFNAALPKGHPFYIRCKSSPEIGSLVKKIYSCRTNAQWQKSEEIGNQNARDTYEEMTSKSWNTSN